MYFPIPQNYVPHGICFYSAIVLFKKKWFRNVHSVFVH